MSDAPASDRTTTGKDNGPPVDDDPLAGLDDHDDTDPKDINGIAGDRLLSFVERLERLDEERRAIVEDMREVRKEAKGTGFDSKIITMLLKIRRRNSDDLAEEETLLQVYKRAIGMAP